MVVILLHCHFLSYNHIHFHQTITLKDIRVGCHFTSHFCSQECSDILQLFAIRLIQSQCFSFTPFRILDVNKQISSIVANYILIVLVHQKASKTKKCLCRFVVHVCCAALPLRLNNNYYGIKPCTCCPHHLFLYSIANSVYVGTNRQTGIYTSEVAALEMHPFSHCWSYRLVLTLSSLSAIHSESSHVLFETLRFQRSFQAT